MKITIRCRVTLAPRRSEAFLAEFGCGACWLLGRRGGGSVLPQLWFNCVFIWFQTSSTAICTGRIRTAADDPTALVQINTSQSTQWVVPVGSWSQHQRLKHFCGETSDDAQLPLTSIAEIPVPSRLRQNQNGRRQIVTPNTDNASDQPEVQPPASGFYGRSRSRQHKGNKSICHSHRFPPIIP